MMAEYIANAAQIVEPNQNVLFSDTVIPGNCSIIHREGSGLVTLRGVGNQCRARFKVTFSGNLAVPTGVTPQAMSLAIAINGEPVSSSSMIITPGAVNQYFNVSSTIFIDVPKCCCSQVSVKSTTLTNVSVQNANFIIERVA